MSPSGQIQAVLLLTAHFSKPRKGDVRPLTPKEWGRFALWLNEHELKPESLLSGCLTDLLAGWKDAKVTLARIEGLLDRGSALALAMEKWTRTGLWVMTRSDPDYPDRIKQHLRTDSPALLFGCGERKLLNRGGIAVVGSRDASDADLGYSRRIGALAAEQGHSIVSGGARGVDEAAMLGALGAEGTAVGVLADTLLRRASSGKYRKHLMSKNLVLVSPFYPEAGFNAGNAMARNKYIYCLSDAALVVHSGTSGGTWTGALENLMKGWVPLWVKDTGGSEPGNAGILDRGAFPLSSDPDALKLDTLLRAQVARRGEPVTGDLFGTEARMDTGPARPTEIREGPQPPEEVGEASSEMGLYDLFLVKVRELCAPEAKTAGELAAALELRKGQVDDWLKRALADGKVEKLTKPVRYRWHEASSGQLGIFVE